MPQRRPAAVVRERFSPTKGDIQVADQACDQRIKSPIAIAIAGVAGSFVFHGAAETGEAERAALMRLYKMYSRSLAGYTPVRTLAKLADEAAHIILARVHQRLPSLPVTEADAVGDQSLLDLAAAAEWSSCCSTAQSVVTSVSTPRCLP